MLMHKFKLIKSYLTYFLLSMTLLQIGWDLYRHYTEVMTVYACMYVFTFDFRPQFRHYFHLTFSFDLHLRK